MPARVVITEYVDVANAFFDGRRAGAGERRARPRGARRAAGGVLRRRLAAERAWRSTSSPSSTAIFRPLAGEGAFGLRDDAGAAQRAAGLRPRRHHRHDRRAACISCPTIRPRRSRSKALRVNLSDLAAKGAKPLAYMLGARACGRRSTRRGSPPSPTGLRADQRALRRSALLGGDTIAVAGRAGHLDHRLRHACRRGGWCIASAAGRATRSMSPATIGAAAAGLALLKGERGPMGRARRERARDALIAALPRAGAARRRWRRRSREFASAAMDVSDGLVGDCDKLAAASGCSAVIEAERVPLPAGLAAADDETLLARLLTAGDDYEILAAVPPANEARFRRRRQARRRAGDADRRARAQGAARREVLFDGTAASAHPALLRARARRGDRMTPKLRPAPHRRRPQGAAQRLRAGGRRRARRLGAADHLRHRAARRLRPARRRTSRWRRCRSPPSSSARPAAPSRRRC